MSLSRAEADAELAAVDDAMRRVKQSRIYRVSGRLTIFWGVVQIAEFAVTGAMPRAWDGWSWAVVDSFGVLVSVLWLARMPRGRAFPARRAFLAYALFYGFGLLWAVGLGAMGGREQAVFWRSLFLFGYSLAGLWFGAGFLVLGLGLTAANYALYLFAGTWFWAAISLVSGLGYVACGLWMLRE